MKKYLSRKKVISLWKITQEFIVGFYEPESTETDFLTNVKEILATWEGISEFKFGTTSTKKILTDKLLQYDKRRLVGKLTDLDRLCSIDLVNFVYVFERYFSELHPIRLVVIQSESFLKLCYVLETISMTEWKTYHVGRDHFSSCIGDGMKTHVVMLYDHHYTLLARLGEG